MLYLETLPKSVILPFGGPFYQGAVLSWGPKKGPELREVPKYQNLHLEHPALPFRFKLAKNPPVTPGKLEHGYKDD